jgi:hypothetical protein
LGCPGHRPPGMTTWLRGARCTDPEAMPEMEARPPAENRHGGAPRGERPASWDAPRLTSADVAPRKRDNRTSAPVGAPPAPRWVGCEGIKDNPGAHALRERRTLRCLTLLSYERCVRRALLSCPGRASISERKAGTWGLHGKTDGQRPVVSPLGPGSRSARASARCTRPGHETEARG